MRRTWSEEREQKLMRESKHKNIIELAIMFQTSKAAIQRKLERLRLDADARDAIRAIDRQRSRDYYAACQRMRGIEVEERDDDEEAPMEASTMDDKFREAMMQAHPERAYAIPPVPQSEPVPKRIHAATQVLTQSVLA